jgi:putative endopeptidase
MRRFILLFTFGLAIPALLAVAPKDAAHAAIHGLDLVGMDRSVAPGDDFYAYANGTWARQTGIPSDRGSFGLGDEVTDLTDRRVAALIKAAAASKAARTCARSATASPASWTRRPSRPKDWPP